MRARPRASRGTCRRGVPPAAARHSSSVIRTSASSGVWTRPAACSARWVSSSGVTRRRWAPPTAPALLTRMSSGPERALDLGDGRVDGARCRSRPRARARPPPAASTVAWAPARSRSRRPRARRPRQAACRSRAPIPDAPPVTAATLPSSLMTDTRLRYGDEPAAHGAGLEALIGRGHVGEPHALDVDVDRTGTRERDHVRELGARAPVRQDDRRLERHGAEAHREGPAAHAEDRDVTAGRHDAGGERRASARRRRSR